MTWSRQALHVAAKDIRQWRVMYALHAFVVTVATVYATGRFHELAILDASFVFVIITGMLLMAVLVQGDSPTRADAFWASKPLAPSAVAAAKLIQVLVVIGVPVLGQSIALMTRGIMLWHVPRTLMTPIAIYSLWLAAAIAASALTKELQGAIVSVIVVDILFGLTLVMMSNAPTLTNLERGAYGVIALAVSAMVLLVAYRKRERARWMRLAVCVPLVAPLVMYLPSPSVAAEPQPLERGAALPLRIVLRDKGPLDRPQLPVDIWLDSVPPGARVELTKLTFTFVLPDGKTVTAFQSGFATVVKNDSLVLPGYRWVGGTVSSAARFTVSIDLDTGTQEKLRSGARSLSASGIVIVRKPHITQTVPLHAGYSFQSGNTRVKVLHKRVAHDDIDAEVETIGPDPADVQLGPYLQNAALANPARREVIRIALDNPTSKTGWLVMPGSSFDDRTQRITARRNIMRAASMVTIGNGTSSTTINDQSLNAELPASIDNAWLNDAALLLLEWRVTGSYRAAGTLSLPAASSDQHPNFVGTGIGKVELHPTIRASTY